MAAKCETSDILALADNAYQAWRQFDAAFNRLCVWYRTQLERFCARLLRNEEDGRDAAQSAIIRAHRLFGSLDDPAKFKGWLFRIATNQCADIARKRGRYVTNGGDTAFDPACVPDSDDQIAAVELRIDLERAMDAVRAAMEKRDDTDRQIFRCRYEDGIDNIAEISRVLDMKENTVRTRATKIQDLVQSIGREMYRDG